MDNYITLNPKTLNPKQILREQVPGMHGGGSCMTELGIVEVGARAWLCPGLEIHDVV